MLTSVFFLFQGDRYDEEPRHYGGSSVSSYGGSHMTNIDEWDSGRKSVAEEVFIDFVKKIVNYLYSI